MSITSAGQARRLRILATTFATLLVASVLFAAPAQAADSWSGVWNTTHKFGTPKLNIELDKDKGPDTLEGTYKNDSGTKGKIWGEVERDGGAQVWTGRFKDNDGASKGKFRVVLQSDQVSFKGWFKTCGSVGCSEKYDWTGEHA